MKEIPKYKVGDVVTIRKSYHEGCREGDYPFHFTLKDLYLYGGSKRVIKEVKKIAGYEYAGKVPFDGVYYILENTNGNWSPYMFEESGDWRDEKKWKPKNGDIVVADDHISIFYDFTDKEDAYSDYVSLNKNGQLFNVYFAPIPKAGFRPATHVERQKLFDALVKRGNRWNAEKKCIESIPPETEEKPLRYGGSIAGFPPEIVEKMLEYQEKQGNIRNVKVFEKDRWNARSVGGFSWDDTNEGQQFWINVIADKNFDVFFERYPKDKLETRPDEVGISQDTADELESCIERLKDQLYESAMMNAFGFSDLEALVMDVIKANLIEPAPKGRLYRKKKGFRPFGKVEKVKPVETRLHTKSK